VRYEIAFPDLPGYQTLKCDFHTHSVFSDGNVWPTVRIDEAWRLGLDATALTDHIEYQPHKDDVPTNHNRPHDLVAGRALQTNMLVPRGAEITKDTPPGHFNAIFLKDVAPLANDDVLAAVKAANEQGGFVFWNHHAWKGEELGAWQDVHTVMVDNKWLHGMEVCNGESYYPSAHAWCLEKNLTMLGTSDIHGPDMTERTTADRHRTMTLVFATERTLDALRDALVNGRTAVWYKNQLIGREQWLTPLFQQCVRVSSPHLRSKDTVWVRLHNDCEMDIELARSGAIGPEALTLPARSTSLVRIGTSGISGPLALSYVATNFRIAADKGLPVTITVP
jgi:hypothetical protein